ncbi:MAG TPA: hypothetical protein VFP79_04275 [Pseudolabrys sp.]|nr:hypothetical protein [Pseudolabrys sp.]
MAKSKGIAATLPKPMRRVMSARMLAFMLAPQRPVVVEPRNEGVHHLAMMLTPCLFLQ